MQNRARCIALIVAAGATPLLAQDTGAPPAPVAADGLAAGVQTTILQAPRRVERRGTSGDILRGPGPVLTFVSTDAPPDADQPLEVAYLADGSAAVIVHRDTDNVTFFDTASRTITHTVAVGDTPTDVAVSPDGRYVVTPDVFGNSVSVIDPATHAVVATVPVTGDQPYAVEITQDGRFAVVGVINDAVASAFSVIDLDTLQEVRSIPSSPQGVIGFFFSPENAIAGEIFTQFALSPDSATILIPDRATTLVNVYDLTTGADLGPIDTGVAAPGWLDISDDGTAAVVGHEGNSARVTELDLTTLSVTGTFTTPENLFERVIRITPDKSQAIVAISNNVIFLDLTSGAETARIQTGSVGDIEISFDGQYAFVSNFNASVIDIATRTRVGVVPFAPCVPAATSPVALEAVALNNRFRENIHLYNINGASSSLLGAAQTGEPPEGDATRDLAISPDGRTVIAANNISANVAIIDAATETVRAWVPTGDRPLAAAVTPDNAFAVVCNADEPAGGLRGTVSVIDLATDTVVATLVTHDRPSAVRISPDGEFAYVLTIAGSDQVYFIRLDGPASAIVGSTFAGQAGSWQGVAYSAISGVELTDDGAIFAVCDSFNDRLNLFDTATRAQVASVVVGDFPITVAFNPAGTRAYVANAFSANLTVVGVDGAASAPITTLPTGDRPFTVNVDAAGAYVYIGNNATNTADVKVLDAASNTFVAAIPIGPETARAAYLSPADSVLYVAATGANGGSLLRIDAAGPASAFIDSTPLSGVPSSLVFSESLRKAVLAQPGAIPDGVDAVSFGAPPCAADWDMSGEANSDDYFAFLTDFFAGDADFNNDGSTDSDDYFAFLATFFIGCP